MKLKILAVALLVLVGSLVLTKKYKVDRPAKGKNHAIIQLLKTGEEKGTCSAFVISDTKAMTAGHCVDVTKQMVDNSKEILKQLNKDEAKIKSQLNKLDNSLCSSNPICMMQVMTIKISLKIIEQEKKKIRSMSPDVFIVRNSKGQDTGIRATALLGEYCPQTHCRDYAVITGNFKDFEKLPIKPTFDIDLGDSLRTCGFAGGKIPPVCTDFTALGPEDFRYTGRGYFLRGMSGGPAIDSNGYAVGIISSVSGGIVMIDTMIGIMDFEIKEEKE